jgi:hypothetical protein
VFDVGFFGQVPARCTKDAIASATTLRPGRVTEKDPGIDQTSEAGKTYYVKITIAAGKMKGHVQMGMVTGSLALREMQKLRPLDRDHVEADYLATIHLTPIKLTSIK